MSRRRSGIRRSEEPAALAGFKELSDQQDLSNEFIISDIIDKFMLQSALGWKMLMSLLKYEGGSAAKALVDHILATYIPEFKKLRKGITDRCGEAFCLETI